MPKWAVSQAPADQVAVPPTREAREDQKIESCDASKLEVLRT